MNRFSRLFATSALALAACGIASATPIAAGGSVTASGITPGTLTFVGGTSQSNVATAFTSQAPAGMTSTFSGRHMISKCMLSYSHFCYTCPHDADRSAINNLPRAIQGLLENIERLTGWKTTIFVGGPNPETGLITTYM